MGTLRSKLRSKRSAASRALALFLVGGVAGWALENLVYPPRYSWTLGGEQARVPFLPVYGVGLAVVGTLAPHLRGRSFVARSVVYGVALGALEATAGVLERRLGHESWDYDGGTVDLKHAAMWGLLSTGAEVVVNHMDAVGGLHV